MNYMLQTPYKMYEMKKHLPSGQKQDKTNSYHKHKQKKGEKIFQKDNVLG